MSIISKVELLYLKHGIQTAPILMIWLRYLTVFLSSVIVVGVGVILAVTLFTVVIAVMLAIGLLIMSLTSFVQ